jgi:cytochrome b
MRTSAGTTTVKVWDLPTRLFHWALVALVAVLWASGEFGRLDLHMKLGQAALSLVLFRVVWGFVGSRTSQFSHFVHGPAAIREYLLAARRGAVRSVGHNPLGAYSVLALLAVLLIQATSGLFASDDIMTDGPLTHLVSSKAVALLSSVHRIGFKLLLVLVALHLAAVIFYRVVKKDDLVRAMVTGLKQVPDGVDGIRFRNPLIALLVLAATAALVWGGVAALGH